MLISLIIPTLNESASLKQTLNRLLPLLQTPQQVEVIICDGGSEDSTLDIASAFAVRVISTAKGRAFQMNAGAREAQGEWLVFLHADTGLPAGWVKLIKNCNSSWGRFNVRLSGSHWFFRVIESMMNYRSALTSVTTGDQTLFFRQDFFKQLGGFPSIPLMEDIAISKAARIKQAPAIIQQPVITSSRRWEQHGILRTVILMWSLRLAYWLGIKPQTLHRFYYSK